jgi:DNA-directed RNA polymerase specialized sigma24 family protein
MSVSSLPDMSVPGYLARLNAESQRQDWEWGKNPDLWLYRDRTTALLQRYLRLAMEVGRLPSLLGREFFRSRVTSYHVSTFEDAVIFVHDIEKCLERLDAFSQKLIAKIVLQEYSQPETAGILGCALRTVERALPEALDQLSEIFLRAGIIKPMCTPGIEQEVCQEGVTEENFASHCLESK